MVAIETNSSFSSAESTGFSAIQSCPWFSTCDGAICNPQILHFTFFSSVWVFKCLFHSHPSLNFFKHFWHLSSLTFLIHFICLLKLSVLLNFFLTFVTFMHWIAVGLFLYTDALLMLQNFAAYRTLPLEIHSFFF